MISLDKFFGTSVRPSRSSSRAPSPSRPCTINIFISQSVVSFDSESTGTTLNIGVNNGLSCSLLMLSRDIFNDNDRGWLCIEYWILISQRLSWTDLMVATRSMSSQPCRVNIILGLWLESRDTGTTCTSSVGSNSGNDISVTS